MRSFHMFHPGGVLVALALLACVPSTAEAEGFYTITVPIDATASNAVVAKDEAVQEGQAIALERLMRRMAMREDFKLLPQVSPDELADLVQSLEIRNERASQVRYLANLSVQFAPEAIREILTAAGVRFAETQSQPVLVLPILEQNNVVTLWDEANPWLIAWASLPQQRDLVPIYVPTGDLQDVTDIGGDKTIVQDKRRMLDIAARYGASDVLRVRASIAPDSSSLKITVRGDRLGTVETPGIVGRTYTAKEGESLDLMLARIAKHISNYMEERWKNENLLSVGFEQLLPVTVPIQTLRDWVMVRQQLETVPIVRRHSVLSMTKQRTYLHLFFQGTLEQLQTALLQQGLRMEPGRGEWLLRSTLPQPPQPPQPQQGGGGAR